MYAQILKYTGLLGGVQIINMLMSILRNKLTAIFIGTTGMGLADLYFRSAELLGSLTNGGISFSAIRQLSLLHEKGNTCEVAHYIRLVRSWIFLAAILGWLVALLAAPFLSLYTIGDYHTTKGFLMLSPLVPMLTLYGGEVAILKGLRMLKKMAVVSALGALCTMLVSLTIYALLGKQGIIPVLLCTTATMLFLNLRLTTGLYPYRLALQRKTFLAKGLPILKLGGAFVLAGILGSGAELLVRAFLSNTTSLNVVGLYGAGFTVIVSYARLVFVAMDADYFPRLSAAGGKIRLRNDIINTQTDVLVLLMSPMLILLALMAPFLVRVLYTEAFMPVVPMILGGLAFMFFKAIYSPMAYLPLANGHSRLYLAMEFLYDLVFSASVIIGYATHGIAGAGLGLSFANAFDFVMLSLVYRVKYDYKTDFAMLRRAALQFVLLFLTVALARYAPFWLKWTGGIPLLAFSLYVSWRVFRQHTPLTTSFSRLYQKFAKKK